MVDGELATGIPRAVSACRRSIGRGMPSGFSSAMARTSSVASGSIHPFVGSASMNGLSSGGRQRRGSDPRHGAATADPTESRPPGVPGPDARIGGLHGRRALRIDETRRGHARPQEDPGLCLGDFAGDASGHPVGRPSGQPCGRSSCPRPLATDPTGRRPDHERRAQADRAGPGSVQASRLAARADGHATGGALRAQSALGSTSSATW